MPVIKLALLAAGLAAAQQDFLLDGLARFEKGDYAGAATSLEKAAVEKDDPRARTFLALSRAAIGQCDTAAPALKAEFDKPADDVLRRLAGLGFVQCLLSRDQWAEAFPVASRLRQLYPDDPDVLYQSARLYLKAWNGVVYEMFQKTSASFRVNQLSAEIFEIQGKYTEAIAEYRKAIEKNPAALNLHFRLGRALLMDSHAPEALEEAIREFQAELALNPNDAAAAYQIGQILVAQQKPEEAARRFQRALELDANLAEALIALGRLKLTAGSEAEAIALLERAVRQLPRSEAARYNLMLAYRNAGRSEDARRQKEELEKLQKPPEGEFTEFLKRLGERPSGRP